LGVIGLAVPAVLVFRTVVDQQQELYSWPHKIARRLTLFGTVLFLGLLTGCPGMYMGGGALDGARFGFNVRAINTNGDGEADTASGHIQWYDDEEEVRFHCVIDETAIFFAH
jgi:hypothetical protein